MSQLPQSCFEAFAEVAEQHPPPAGLRLGETDHRLQLVQFDALLLGIAALLDQAAADGDVAVAEQQQRFGRQAVAPGAAGLLVVALDVLGQVVVHDEAHVRLVDAHAEGDGRHDDLQIVAQEHLLHLPALLIAQAGMVGPGLEAGGRQAVGHFFDPLAREGVDDPGFLSAPAEKRQQLIERLLLFDHRVADVRPVEAGDETARLLQAEPLQDVLPGLRIGGGGQADHRHRREELAQLAELHVFRAEIVPPLGDAVGLVDGEQGDRQLLEPVEEAVAEQPLRGDVEQVEFTGMQPGQDLTGLRRLQRRIVERRTHAVGHQGVDLVLHQGDQRRYHDRHTLPVQGRNLVAEGLAAAGRHQDKGILPRDQRLDDLSLLGTEAAVAEDLKQGLA